MKRTILAFVLAILLMFLSSCKSQQAVEDPVQKYIDTYVTEDCNVPQKYARLAGSIMREVCSEIEGKFKYSLNYSSINGIESITVRAIQEDTGLDKTWCMLITERSN